jgi:hypothetical protein
MQTALLLSIIRKDLRGNRWPFAGFFALWSLASFLCWVGGETWNFVLPSLKMSLRGRLKSRFRLSVRA